MTSLFHNLEQVRSFYSQFPKAIVGVEASCSAAWFEQLLAELGHDLKVGNRTLIRTRFGSISKAGSSVLRHLPGQAMHVTIRYDGELRSFYKRLATRRSKSIAKVATTRKLLIRLFNMLRDEIDYQEFKRRGSAVGMPVLSHGLK